MALGIRAGTPTLEVILERAEALLPRLRERARKTEELRRLPDETIQDFLDAGLFRVLQPARYGGFELDYGRTQVELGNVLGRACGSSAWVQSVVAVHAWCLAMFPVEAQEAVWGSDQDSLICTAFSVKTGKGRAVDGGYYIEGEWEFSSGCQASQWIMLGTPIVQRDGSLSPGRRLWCLLPRQDWEILDTWYAAGLKGTGTHDIRVKGTFVPTAFTLDTSECDGRPTPGSVVNPSPLYRLPLWPIFPYSISVPALGIARGAIEAYVEYLRGRPDRANMVQRQLRVGESSAEVDAALALMRADAAEISHTVATGQPLSQEFLAKSRRDTSFMVQLCLRAIDRLAAAVGAHGMLDDTPVQRAFRDLHAIANHGANGLDVTAVVYARHALGLPPLDLF